ncbi:MAG: MerR family transcriptional regulator [Methyloceanibacter sp.]|nr:MerR family transcriptional regulator [Methyloceanibacter sp.]
MDKAPEAFRTISEVADQLDVPKHVLRFWEAKFSQLKPMKRGGGRRYYRPEDVALLKGIRLLLYSDGYTIRGVQKILREQGPRYVMDYQGLGDLPRAEDTMAPDIPDVAANVVRGAVSQEIASEELGSQDIGSVEDDIAALIDELETCRQILANADRQD